MRSDDCAQRGGDEMGLACFRVVVWECGDLEGRLRSEWIFCCVVGGGVVVIIIRF